MRVILALLLLLTWASSATSEKTLLLAGPPAIVSAPLLYMIDSGALADIADNVEFRLWKDPDQLRLLALGKQADFIAMPSNVAANLYNRGVPVRLMNISAWGILHMLSRDPALKTLADFRGKEIAMPFRADMPDLVFGLLARQQGLDPKADFKLRYVASPLDAMQLLLLRRVDHALLAEPAVSMALRKTGSYPLKLIAPELHRSLDLQQEWGRVYQRPVRLPQAGLVAIGTVRTETALLQRVNQAYAEALFKCQKNPQPCAEIMVRSIPMLSTDAVIDALQFSGMKSVNLAQAEDELRFFFTQLLQQEPAILGGKIPDAAFFRPLKALDTDATH